MKRGLEISMKAYFRAHAVKEDPESIELYKLYKEAGIDVLIIGAEAGSDYELEIYEKDAVLEDNYRCVRVLDDLNLFFVHVGLINFGPYSTMDSLRQNIRFLQKNERCFRWEALVNTLILTPGATLYESMDRDNRILPRENFWEFPSYIFEDDRVRNLAKHYTGLSTQYPHLTSGDNVYLNTGNIVSRLKNKMNQRVAEACAVEIAELKEIFLRGRKTINDLSYDGFVENLNRAEKDGANAKFVSEPYYGKLWKAAVDELDEAYVGLTETIQAKGFGLGGLIFVGQQTAWDLNNRHRGHRFGADEVRSATSD